MRIPSAVPVRSSAFALATAFAAAISAQDPTPIPAPADLLRAFDTRAGVVEDLALPMSSDQAFVVRVSLDGAPRTLELHPHDVRAPNFALLVDDGVTIRQVPTPPSVTFRGWIAGDHDSRIAASLVDGQLRALVLMDGQSWEITPVTDGMPGLPRTAHIVFRGSDLVGGDKICATPDAGHDNPGALGGTLGGAPGGSAGGAAGGGPEPDAAGGDEAEIALDCDFRLYQRRGSSVTSVQNDVTNIINGCGVIYRRDVALDFAITNIMVRTSSTYTSTTTALLSEFRNRWNSQHSGIQRDLAHLFSGKSSPGTTIGIAQRGTVCNRSSAYGVSWTLYSSSTQSRIALTSHEMGHNFNAGHCNGSSQCHLMCSTLGACGANWKFAPVSITVINNFIASRGCLRPPPPPIIPSLSLVSPSSLNHRRPPLVTLTGTDLNTVQQVTLSGVPVTNFTNPDPTTIQFTLPSGYDIANHPVVATNGQGASNALNLDVQGTHPAAMEVPFAHVAGLTLPYVVWTDRSWSTMFFVSTSGLASPFPGVVNFGIGNNFAELFFLAQVPADQGGRVQLDIPIPTTIPRAALFWQAVVFDPLQFPVMLPLEVSDVAVVSYL